MRGQRNGVFLINLSGYCEQLHDHVDYRSRNIVTHILVPKNADPANDTSALEHEIDKIVCKLYGLTKDEIRIVEGW